MKKRVLYLMVILVFALVSCVGVSTFSMTYIYGIVGTLILFSVISCSGAGLSGPIGNDNLPVTGQIEPAKFDLSYLDKDFKHSETVTDIIAMTVKDKAEGFVMMSKKTDNGEHRVYLTDKNSGLAITFYYKDREIFPYRITTPVTAGGGGIASGRVTPHRRDSKEFDIIWNLGSQYQTFGNIPLGNEMYSFGDIPGLDADRNYQVLTMLVSVKVMGATVEHVINTPDYSMTRGCGGAIVAAIVAVVSMVVAAVFPPLAPIFGPIAIIAGSIASGLSSGGATDVAQETETIEAKPKIINIAHHDASNHFDPDKNVILTDGETFNIVQFTDPNSVYENNHLHLNLDIPYTNNISKHFDVYLVIPDSSVPADLVINNLGTYILTQYAFFQHKDGVAYNAQGNELENLVLDVDANSKYGDENSTTFLIKNFPQIIDGYNFAIRKLNLKFGPIKIVLSSKDRGASINGDGEDVGDIGPDFEIILE